MKDSGFRAAGRALAVLSAAAAAAFVSVLVLGRNPAFRSALLEWNAGGWPDAALEGTYPVGRSFRALLWISGSLALAWPAARFFFRRRGGASAAASSALFAASLLLGFLLRFDLWATKSFWNDAWALKAGLRARSFAELLSGPIGFGQSAPVGFSLFGKAVGELSGWSDRALTFPLLLAGLAVLVLVPLAVSRAGARRLRAPAALLVALSPQLVYYSAEFKQYGFDALFAVLSLLAALELGAGRRPRALLAAVFVAGPLFSHTQFFLLPGLGLVLFPATFRSGGTWRRPTRADLELFAACGALGGAAALASWVHVVSTMPDSMSAFWAAAFPPAGSPGAFAAWWAEKACLFFRDPFAVLPAPSSFSWSRLPLFLPVPALLLFGACTRRRPVRAAAWLAATSLALLVVASSLRKWPVRAGTDSAIESRHLLFLLPSAFFFLALALDRLRGRCLPLAAAVAVAAVPVGVSRLLCDRIYSWSLPDALSELARRASGDEPILLGYYEHTVASAYAPEWYAENKPRISVLRYADPSSFAERLGGLGADRGTGFWILWTPRAMEGRVVPALCRERLGGRRADFVRKTPAGILQHFPAAGNARASVRFALCQTEADPGAGADPVSAALSVAAQAVSNRADVVVLPELSFLSFARLASERNFPAPDEEAAVRDRLSAFAASNRVYVLANAPRSLDGAGSRHANESVLFGPSGETVAAYRKRCMARSDGVIGFVKGDGPGVAELPFARIGLLVCKDATRPDLFRDDYAGCDLLVAQFAHPFLEDAGRPEGEWCETEEEAADAFGTIAENWLGDRPKPMLFVNKAGPDGPFRFPGGTRAVDAFGRVAGALGRKPGVLFVDFPLDGAGRVVPSPLPVPAIRPEPVPDGEAPGPVSVGGRKVDWFRHRMVEAWNAPDPDAVRTFAVVHPSPGNDRPGAPLVLALHSHAFDAVRLVESLSEPGNHDVWKTPDDCYELVPDCSPQPPEDSPEFWWCCANHYDMPGREEAARSGRNPSACEKRVMETLEWTVRNYGIDRNRIYACGNSMGGQGALGVALPRGDVFAAVKASVPAGVWFPAARLGFVDDAGRETPDPAAVAGRTPDPPVCVECSSPRDRWSAHHGFFLRNMARFRFPLLAFWGDFGHAHSDAGVLACNDIANRFDWLSVRRDDPCPVFTGASCDDVSPWDSDERAGTDWFPPGSPPGQINGFFRWTPVSRSPESVEMDIRLATPEELRSSAFSPPASATADVSLRRLGDFPHAPGTVVSWRFGPASGTVAADGSGVFTIPALRVSRTPERLSLRARASPAF